VRISKDAHVNTMDSIGTNTNHREFIGIRRRVTLAEFDEAVAWARKTDLRRIDVA